MSDIQWILVIFGIAPIFWTVSNIFIFFVMKTASNDIEVKPKEIIRTYNRYGRKRSKKYSLQSK